MRTLGVVSILGQQYKVIECSPKENQKLLDCDGYMDHSVHKIVVFDGTVQHPENAIEDMEAYKRKVIRHEIIHAFLSESGLQENSVWDDTHSEQMVDWIAIQLPKIIQVLLELGVAELKRSSRSQKKEEQGMPDAVEELFKKALMDM